MTKKLLLLLTLCGWLNSFAISDFHLNSRRIATDNGLPGNTINELVQDEQGYIWMATNNGLSRYDGYSALNFSSFSHNGKTLEGRIGRITYDPAGLLWLSTATYVNACYDLSAGRFVDWTGKDDCDRQLNKMMLSRKRGMFLYGNAFGIWRSQYEDGTFRLTDYTSEGGQLPSDNVLQLLEDAAENIWIPTDNGIALLDHNEKIQHFLPGQAVIGAATHGEQTFFLTQDGTAYLFDAQGHEMLNSKLSASIGVIAKVNISFCWQGKWMVFCPEGTYAMDARTGMWSKESGERNVIDGLNQGSCNGFQFISNKSGRLWIYPKEGECYTLTLLSNAGYSVNRGRKFHIIDDEDGRLFIATYGNGLFVLDPQTRKTHHFVAEQPNAIIRSNFLIYAIRDHQGNIWLGSEDTGAYCLTVLTDEESSEKSFARNYVLPEPDRLGDWSNAVSCVAQLADSSIVIGTRVGGIYAFRQQPARMEKIAERQAHVSAIFSDSDKRLWIGTFGDGLTYDGQTYRREDPKYRLPENKILDFCQDSLGRVWIATRDGGLLMTEPAKTGQPLLFKQYLTGEMNESRLKDLELSPDGMLWIATNNGIYRVDTRMEKIDGEAFKHYNTANGQFPSDEIFTLHYSATDSMLWVGAANTGAVRCRLTMDGAFELLPPITTLQGLGNNNVYSYEDDPYGYVWAGTEDGISRINPRNNIVNTYHPSPILQGNVAMESSAILSRDGVLLFGTNYGMVMIRPDNQDVRGDNLRARITDIQVNGVSQQQFLIDGGRKSLAHDQNTISFFFSNFNYDHTQSSLYQYYLEGVDKTWQTMTTINHADYTLLPPGSYVFHVRSLDSNNEWQEETTLSIRIRQPWYNAWWAWLIYMICIAFFGIYIYINWKEKFDLHQQMKLQEQLSDFRMQLFTNVTHEFRTPLAIIKGSIDKLDNKQNAVKTAQRGVHRMLKLVNQFLDFRRATSGNLRLKVSEGDLVEFVRDIYQDFWPMSNQRDLQLTFQPSSRSIKMYFDRQIVETILYNLLSNAIKYTPEKGHILLKIKENENMVNICCEDSGPGISKERQEAMFKPFMQGLASTGGMGIGLYTAYVMAQIHHGELSYQQSSLLGGACLTFSLPIRDDVYLKEDYEEDTEQFNEEETVDKEVDAIIQEMQPEALNNLTIAIIEDDYDMMEQLRSEMGKYFHVMSYSNGAEGFHKVSETRPALLLCDVMLPGMNGYEIVSQLRQQPSTADLPIILLTALGDENHQLKAYQAGADDYMVKPCSFRLLVAKAIQLIKWKRATGVHSEEQEDTELAQTEKSSSIFTSQADKVFRDKLEMLIVQNMNDPYFTVDRLAEMMTMGRTKFYGKVKEITGISPNKYLMLQRMKKAADLLADGEMNVSEVSYRVGIQDPSYFNKCFKAQYGVVPSKYLREAES